MKGERDMKKFVCVFIVFVLTAACVCACDDIYEVPFETKITVDVCGEKICSATVVESTSKGFRLNESEEKKMIESFMSSPYYIGRFTVRYTDEEVTRYGEGESAYWFDFGDMNVGYIVKSGNNYLSFSHSVAFSDRENSFLVWAENFLTGDFEDENNLYMRIDGFDKGESYPVAYGWNELKEIFRNYDIDENEFSIAAVIYESYEKVYVRVKIKYVDDTQSIVIDMEQAE